jgi:hypothetical protein
MLKSLASAAAVVVLLQVPALAGQGADITRSALYEGSFGTGRAGLEPLAEGGDQEARFGLGLITFVETIEGFAQALYRHGLASPETGEMGPAMMLPVPINPDPEPLDYTKVRGILQGLVTGMDDARNLLEAAGESGDYVVEIDPLGVRIDVDGDGRADETETIGLIFMSALEPGGRPRTPPAPAEPSQRRDGRIDRPSEPPAGHADDVMPELIIGLDRADGFWLAGYSQVLAAQADLLLAHDFEDFVNVSFHRLFPRARLPMQDFARGGMLMLDPESDTAIADAIAAIHTLNWPVVEPERLARVRERFLTVVALSRKNWDAILAETDDNRELVPNPGQTSLVPDAKVTDETVSAWMETLDVVEQILEGELLVPHWRFRQGFDLKAYFETARRTDLVMLLTGYDALPYIKAGPVATAESFAAANRVFGDDFLGYVFWFN